MTGIFKDQYRVGQLLALLFLIGVAVSLYQVYSLPAGLSIMAGYRAAFIPVYVVLALTFLLGFIAIYYALQNRREIVVFRDKTTQNDRSEKDNASATQGLISLEVVREKIRSGGEKEILQNGLHAICKHLDAGQGAIYKSGDHNGQRNVELKGGYALSIGESTVISYEYGEGLIGQAAAGGKTLYIDDVPENYIKIVSGLGSASPKFLLIVPIKHNDAVVGVLEIATFTAITPEQRKFVEDSAQLIAEKITTH